MNTPILSIVGRSNSGKTTLLEKLIAELTNHGLRIGTIKHSHHQPSLDTPGKDSWRHKQAGAAAALLVGSRQMQLVADLHIGEEAAPRELAARLFTGMDLVLLEGYGGMPGPKIEVVRAACASTMRHADDEGLIAVASDVTCLDTALPCFGLDDTAALTRFVLAWRQAQ